MPSPPPAFGYEPPRSRGGERPVVILLGRLYAGLHVSLAITFAFVWVFLTPRGTAISTPVTLAVVGFSLVYAALHLTAALAPYKPWGWTVMLVVLGVGLTGCVFLSVPLLVFWLKPSTKAAFCRL